MPSGPIGNASEPDVSAALEAAAFAMSLAASAGFDALCFLVCGILPTKSIIASPSLRAARSVVSPSASGNFGIFTRLFGIVSLRQRQARVDFDTACRAQFEPIARMLRDRSIADRRHKALYRDALC